MLLLQPETEVNLDADDLYSVKDKRDFFQKIGEFNSKMFFLAQMYHSQDICLTDYSSHV